jgi:hypothetical protein
MGISDYYAILKIVDESYRDEELSVHIFTYKLEDLPQVMSYKDYIVLHQVKVFLEFQCCTFFFFWSILCFRIL